MANDTCSGAGIVSISATRRPPLRFRQCVRTAPACSDLTRWERALLALAAHYNVAGGYSLYGSWMRALRDAAVRGCADRRQFRTAVADIFGADKNGTDMHRMANVVALGRLSDALRVGLARHG
jgi:hypothetical protein